MSCNFKKLRIRSDLQSSKEEKVMSKYLTTRLCDFGLCFRIQCSYVMGSLHKIGLADDMCDICQYFPSDSKQTTIQHQTKNTFGRERLMKSPEMSGGNHFMQNWSHSTVSRWKPWFFKFIYYLFYLAAFLHRRAIGNILLVIRELHKFVVQFHTFVKNLRQ